MHEWYLHPADVFLSRRVKTILESFDLHTESKSESDTARAMRLLQVLVHMIRIDSPRMSNMGGK